MAFQGCDAGKDGEPYSKAAVGPNEASISGSDQCLSIQPKMAPMSKMLKKQPTQARVACRCTSQLDSRLPYLFRTVATRQTCLVYWRSSWVCYLTALPPCEVNAERVLQCTAYTPQRSGRKHLALALCDCFGVHSDQPTVQSVRGHCELAI